MLTNTFLHIPGIGPATEKRLWGLGIAHWGDYFREGAPRPFAGARQAQVAGYLEQSQEALEAEDFRFFAKMLSSKEQWRALPEFGFGGKIAYLDIETTGMGEWAEVTVVGVYDGADYRAYIRDINLHEFRADIAQYAMLATFFGTGFDLPFLRREFSHLRFEQLHVDLCFLLRRLGHRGGLKAIEEKLGIARSAATQGLSGYDAVRLWREYRRGSEEALELLVRYNREDVVNLEALARLGYAQMRERSGLGDIVGS